MNKIILILLLSQVIYGNGDNCSRAYNHVEKTINKCRGDIPLNLYYPNFTCYVAIQHSMKLFSKFCPKTTTKITTKPSTTKPSTTKPSTTRRRYVILKCQGNPIACYVVKEIEM